MFYEEERLCARGASSRRRRMFPTFALMFMSPNLLFFNFFAPSALSMLPFSRLADILEDEEVKKEKANGTSAIALLAFTQLDCSSTLSQKKFATWVTKRVEIGALRAMVSVEDEILPHFLYLYELCHPMLS